MKTYRAILEILPPAPLLIARKAHYISSVPRDYGHKRARNKRIGPGGGTRQLHQTSLIWGQMGLK